MDPEGFDCGIFKGMGQNVADKIEVINFEWSQEVLDDRGCSENMLSNIRNLGFDLYSNFSLQNGYTKLVTGDYPPGGRDRILNLYAVKSA